MMPSLSPEEGAPASPCGTVASPVCHMHPDVAELLQAARTTPRRRRRKNPAPPAAADEARGRVRYGCAFEENAPAGEDGDRFAPSRLVWVKVSGYPWWPGQVFDPSDASKLALSERRNRRRDAVLVACFGDESFLWADAEDLFPLREDFQHLAKIGGRSKSRSAFASAVDDVLNEVSRRAEAGLSCGCRAASIKKQVSRRLDAGLSCGCRAASTSKKQVTRPGRSCGSCAASIKKQDFSNSGVRRGARGATVDAAFARDAFRGEAFVGYVRALAVAPTAGADMLDLAVASAQLEAFTRWRSVAPPTNGAMVAGARATTPRRGDGGDAPAGDMAMSLCARAAAADVAFTRDVFRGEAAEEYDSAMALTPPPAGSERCDLAVSTMAQPNAFSQWRGTASGNFTECTATMDVTASGAMDAATPPPVRRDTAKKARSPGGDNADADPGNGRIMTTSCISSRGDSGCENDSDDGSEAESEDLEVSSGWEVGWKDYVILMQFVAIVMLVCQLMQ